MKNIKLFMLMAVAAMFAACSDTDINTTPVEVGFELNTISFNETDGIVKVPIKIKGEANGCVKVKVKTTDGTAIGEKHYILTGENINIPAGEAVNLELRILDDGQEENDNREFKITIESAEGATISETNNEIHVVIKDVDAVPFFKLFGTYVCEAIDPQTNDPINFIVTLNDENEGTQEYLYGDGQPSIWTGGFETKMIFGFVGDGQLTFEPGYWDCLYNFGSFYAVACYQPYNLSGEKYVPVESSTATYDESFSTITFAEGTYVSTAIYAYDLNTSTISDYKGYYDTPILLVKMTKEDR